MPITRNMATAAAIIKNSGELINSGIIDSEFWVHAVRHVRLFLRESWLYCDIAEMGRSALAVYGLSIPDV